MKKTINTDKNNRDINRNNNQNNKKNKNNNQNKKNKNNRNRNNRNKNNQIIIVIRHSICLKEATTNPTTK